MGANDRAGVQHAVAAHLNVAAQDRANFFPLGGHPLLPFPDDNEGLVALDVGGDGACTHMGVAA